MIKQDYKVYAVLTKGIMTKKIAIQAVGYHDAARAWLNHRNNRQWCKYNLMPGRQEGYTRDGDFMFTVYRVEAVDPWMLDGIVIWLEEKV